MSESEIPEGVIIFGPDATCTIDTCPVEWSLYGFQPSLVANIVFPAVFAVIAVVHAYLGWKWRSWGFMTGMLLGCVAEIIGYVGRIMLHYNPFSFVGFMIQIGTSCQYRRKKKNLTISLSSLHHYRSRLLHSLHLRHPLQSNHLLCARTLPLQAATLLLDLYPF
jgi:hypothetical protein